MDKDGAEHEIAAGSVVIAVGFEPRAEQAMQFDRVGETFFAIGDCQKVGCVQKVMRSAYSTACML